MDFEDKILVLGIGNDMLTDDGIGPKLVFDLKSNINSCAFDFKNTYLSGFELLDQIAGYSRVIILDGTKVKGAKPGQTFYYIPDTFQETLHLSNFHEMSFLLALEFGRKIGMKIPDEIYIVAIQIMEDCVFNLELSPQLKKEYPRILIEVSRFLHEQIYMHFNTINISIS